MSGGGSRWNIQKTPVALEVCHSPTTQQMISTKTEKKCCEDYPLLRCWFQRCQYCIFCMIVICLILIAIMFFLVTDEGARVRHETSNIYQQIINGNEVIDFGFMQVCQWNEIRPANGSNEILLNGQTMAIDSIIPPDSAMIEGKNCANAQQTCIFHASPMGVTGSYENEMGESLMTADGQGYSMVEPIVASSPAPVDETGALEFQHNKYITNRNADYLYNGYTKNGQGARRKLLLPGEIKIYLHLEIDGTMRDLFGGDEYQTAAYGIELIALINEKNYHPIGFDLTVVSVRVYDGLITNGESTRDYLYYVDDFPAPDHVHLVHVLTNRKIGGGIAYMGGVYTESHNFGVSASLNGGFSAWDQVVVAHEIGHNLGAEHTHDRIPPIDTCGQECPSNPSGTIMSYCHTCSGGMSNIVNEFHSRTQEQMLTDHSLYGDFLAFASACKSVTSDTPDIAVAFYFSDTQNCIQIDVSNCYTCSVFIPNTCEHKQVYKPDYLTNSEFLLRSSLDSDYCWSTTNGCQDISLQICNDNDQYQKLRWENGNLFSIQCNAPMALKSDGIMATFQTTNTVDLLHHCAVGNIFDTEDGGGAVGVLENAPTITCGATISGSTETTTNVIGNTANDAFFKFIVPNTNSLTFNTCGSSFDTYLRVYNDDLSSQLTFCDDQDSNCGGTCGTRSILLMQMDQITAGDELVLVLEGWGISVGDFDLTMECGGVASTSTSTASPTTSTTSTNAPISTSGSTTTSTTPISECLIDCSSPQCLIQNGLTMPCCSGGECQQHGAHQPSCDGGSCDQTLAHNPSCDGGFCDQTGSVYPSCNGGGCVQVATVAPTCYNGDISENQCQQNSAIDPVCHSYCGQNEAKNPLCLNGFCLQDDSVHPSCFGSGQCSQIGTVNAGCGGGNCIGSETGDCTNVDFTFFGGTTTVSNVEPISQGWEVLDSVCAWNDHDWDTATQTTCCLRDNAYTVKCTDYLWRSGWNSMGSSLWVDEAEICHGFDSGEHIYDMLSIGAADSCIDVTVQLVTASWASEISWYLHDLCNSDGTTYSNYGTFNSQCCLFPGVYELSCEDAYGDGWHSGQIFVDGEEYCKDFLNGNARLDYITIGSSNESPQENICSETFDVTVYTNVWASEMSWSIIEVDCSGSNYDNFQQYTETCCVPESNKITVECGDSYGDGWSQNQMAKLTLFGQTVCKDFNNGFVTVETIFID